MYPSGSLMLPLFPNPGSVFASSLFLHLPLHLIHLVFLAALTYTATVRFPCHAIFKDFTMLEWGPSLAQDRGTFVPAAQQPSQPSEQGKIRGQGEPMGLMVGCLFESQWCQPNSPLAPFKHAVITSL